MSYKEVLDVFGIYEVTYNNKVTYFTGAAGVVSALNISDKSFPLYLNEEKYPGLKIRKVLKTVYDEFIPYHIRPIPLPKIKTGSSSRRPHL